MKISNYLTKPEYLFRPTQIYRRMLQPKREGYSKFQIVTLPWKVSIKVRPHESIGRSIVELGVYELSVTEVLWRLIDPNELTVDIGANVGYMTSVMAKRVGRGGKVFSFEPHHEIYEELCENKRMWRQANSWDQIESYNLALSDIGGIGTLNMPPHFTQNRGVASLLDEFSKPANSSHSQCEVALARLDELMSGQDFIAVIKLDVEGHELRVLKGASRVLANHVRDIVFEEHRGYPSEVASFLENLGFTIFRICKELWGPRLETPVGGVKDPHLPWEPPNYLATKDPLRVAERMKKKGWRTLSNS